MEAAGPVRVGVQGAHNQIDEGGFDPPGAQSMTDKGSGNRESKKPVDSGLPKADWD